MADTVRNHAYRPYYSVERTNERRQTVRVHRAKSNQALKNFRAHGADGDVDLPRFLGTQGYLSY